jgi:hypothetical protein
LRVLITNIRLGWRGLPGTNTLAYFAFIDNEKEKSFKRLEREEEKIESFHFIRE